MTVGASPWPAEPHLRQMVSVSEQKLRSVLPCYIDRPPVQRARAGQSVRCRLHISAAWTLTTIMVKSVIRNLRNGRRLTERVSVSSVARRDHGRAGCAGSG